MMMNNNKSIKKLIDQSDNGIYMIVYSYDKKDRVYRKIDLNAQNKYIQLGIAKLYKMGIFF